MILEHLLSAWSNITRQLKDASDILLLTDYDGTLTPIVERPELANLSEETRRLLEALAHQPKFRRLDMTRSQEGIFNGAFISALQPSVGLNETDSISQDTENPLMSEVRAPFRGRSLSPNVQTSEVTKSWN